MMAVPRADGLLAKVRALRGVEAATLAEAMLLVLAAAPLVRFLPLARVGQIGARPLKSWCGTLAERAETIERIAWAVARAAKRSPLRALCFERGLAAQIMLRRRGIDATLFYGVTLRDGTLLDAHVWITADDLDVAGGAVAKDYAVLKTFPAGRETRPLPVPRWP